MSLGWAKGLDGIKRMKLLYNGRDIFEFESNVALLEDPRVELYETVDDNGRKQVQYCVEELSFYVTFYEADYSKENISNCLVTGMKRDGYREYVSVEEPKKVTIREQDRLKEPT